MSGPTSDIEETTGAASPGENAKGAIARDAIAEAAEILGGAQRLAAWANADEKNEDKFWTTLYPKLIPLQLTGEAGGPIRIAAAIEAARKRARGPDSNADLTSPASAPKSPSPAPVRGDRDQDDGGAA